jgi:hypothetical protein
MELKFLAKFTDLAILPQTNNFGGRHFLRNEPFLYLGLIQKKCYNYEVNLVLIKDWVTFCLKPLRV